jgi:predicted secreted protein
MVTALMSLTTSADWYLPAHPYKHRKVIDTEAINSVLFLGLFYSVNGFFSLRS